MLEWRRPEIVLRAATSVLTHYFGYVVLHTLSRIHSIHSKATFLKRPCARLAKYYLYKHMQWDTDRHPTEKLFITPYSTYRTPSSLRLLRAHFTGMGWFGAQMSYLTIEFGRSAHFYYRSSSPPAVPEILLAAQCSSVLDELFCAKRRFHHP